MADLRREAAEHSGTLHMASETLGAIQAQFISLEGHLAATREQAQRAEQAATIGLQGTVAGELHALESTVKGHAAAIESIRGAMARTDDFMERVVEALESLQTMVLDQAHAPTSQN
jgi:predicted  nucleic acid-binding Zn-ribbon protein